MKNFFKKLALWLIEDELRKLIREPIMTDLNSKFDKYFVEYVKANQITGRLSKENFFERFDNLEKIILSRQNDLLIENETLKLDLLNSIEIIKNLSSEIQRHNEAHDSNRQT